MTNRVKAVFENGVFRPIETVSLADGTNVELSFENRAPLKPPQPLVEALAEIARMPVEGPDEGFSGADHDNVLYGKDGAW